MTAQDRRNLKETLFGVCRRHNVRKAALFGSIARGEETAESDIDLLVEFDQGKTLFDLVGLKLELEDAIGRKVDVVTYASLHPLLKELILAEQEVVL